MLILIVGAVLTAITSFPPGHAGNFWAVVHRLGTLEWTLWATYKYNNESSNHKRKKLWIDKTNKAFGEPDYI